jgi:hypothetical protein
VYIALASIDGDASAGAPAVQVRAFQFVGDRSQIREWSVRMSLVMLYQRLVGVQAKLLRELAS